MWRVVKCRSIDDQTRENEQIRVNVVGGIANKDKVLLHN